MSSGRDAVQRDLVGISSEKVNVLVNPFDRCDLISQTEVLEVGLLRQDRRKEAERSNLVRERGSAPALPSKKREKRKAHPVVEGDANKVLRSLRNHTRDVEGSPRTANEEPCRAVKAIQ